MCNIDYVDSDGEWVTDPHVVISSKDRRCDDCGRTIYDGEGYTYGEWLERHEGFSSLHVCEHCVTAGRWLNVVCGGHLWPGVTIDIADHWREEPELRSHGLGRLKLWGAAKWERDGRMVTVAEVKVAVDAALSRLPTEAKS